MLDHALNCWARAHLAPLAAQQDVVRRIPAPNLNLHHSFGKSRVQQDAALVPYHGKIKLGFHHPCKR